jgi:hypothetical protein
LIHTLLPLNDDHREDIATVRGELWELYADLKKYKRRPNNPDGHFKFLHLWPGQNPPLDLVVIG